MKSFSLAVFISAVLLLSGCASTTVIESPKTTTVSASEPEKTPEIIWTSKTLNARYDYLGEVKVKSWSYDGALERLVDGGKKLKADALIDVQYRQVGFLTTFEAFAIKFKP
jgi:outer membrane murein-binding lipoprotein Lpp